MKKTTTFLLFIAYFALTSHAQNWVPLDKGLPYADVQYILADSNCIYVAGNIIEDGNGISMRGIAKWDGTKWDSVGDANNFNATKHGLYKYHDTLLTSGSFYDWPYTSLARLVGNTWVPFPNTRDLSVNRFCENDSLLYLGGWFNVCGNDSTYLLGTFDGTTFLGLTPNYSWWYSGDLIRWMQFYQDTLYVTGQFKTHPLGTIAYSAKWDGANLVHINHVFDSLYTNGPLIVYQNELYFEYRLANTEWQLMKYDGNNLTSVGEHLDKPITQMMVYNNELYAVGYFNNIDSLPCNNVAKWNGSYWICLNQDAFDVPFLKDLCVFNDELYISGYFSKIGNDTIYSVAKYNHPLIGIKENKEEENYLSIYPVPVSDKLIVDCYKKQNIKLSIYNVLGQLLFNSDLFQAKSEINISFLPTGIYIIKVSGTDWTEQKKIIKK